MSLDWTGKTFEFNAALVIHSSWARWGPTRTDR
jgi:hypothetical protein